MNQHFTHLHLHTEYSLLDGAISLDRLISFGQQNQFKALAITDHGNIFGAVKFFQKCKKAGIKPILGIEAYTTIDAKVKDPSNKYYHLVLLVQNEQGYRNLCKLIAFSYQEGFYFKPRIDYQILQKYHEGLIAFSSCLGGHIPQLLINDQDERAVQQLNWFMDLFGPDRFFLEVQPEDQSQQAILNKKLYALSEQYQVPLVATADCHYVNEDDREAHEVMLALQTQDKMSNPNRYTFGDCRVHMRTTQQMLDIFHEHPEAVWNTGRIADRCEFSFQTGKLFFPKFEVPGNISLEDYFSQLCRAGLERLENKELFDVERKAEYQERLEIEITLIIKMGFVGYFLVVSDFIVWAYNHNIPVGPGRGSAAGSLVAWALQITNIDPIKYNLLFERFLNPERVTMPDIDIDFCIEQREKVIDYIRNKYGHDKVCHIITFGTMLAKGVIKDVARVLGFSFEDADAFTSLIPEQLKITLAQAIEQEPRLKELIDNNPQAQKLFSIARRLEGLARHASKHAAGIVISPDPVSEALPLYVPPKSNELVTQYGMVELEELGFLKMDLLGLKNLTLIDRVIKMIACNHDITIDINKLPLDDLKTFALVSAGNTSGVFQLESEGLKEVLCKLQPEKFEDIIAVNALYRPGPLGSGMVDDFIERRHGRQKINYLLPELEPILNETYGVIVYQEQVMKIASAIGGYSLGEADILRRAMGKKKAEVMAEQRALFLSRAQERGFDSKKSGELFDLMEYFAGYGFNKSHSAAYALIAYQTAYLKANYPAEFMACLISLETSNAEKMVFYVHEARQMGLALLPPDINQSGVEFLVKNGQLLFGLQGIKNVGLAALEDIIAQREKDGAFADLLDLCRRIDLRVANKRVLEHLVASGACDSLPGNRAQKHHELSAIIDKATSLKKDAQTGQMGLFGGARISDQAQPIMYDPHQFALRDEWDIAQKLEHEKESLGFYLSSHPYDVHKEQLRWFSLISFQEAQQMSTVASPNGAAIVVCAGLLKQYKQIVTKKGDQMAFIQLEDANTSAEIVVFPKLFCKVQEWITSYKLFVVKGAIDTLSSKQCKIKADMLVPVELVLQEWFGYSLEVRLPAQVHDEMLQQMRTLLGSGKVPLELAWREEVAIRCIVHDKVFVDMSCIHAIEQLGCSLTVRL